MPAVTVDQVRKRWPWLAWAAGAAFLVGCCFSPLLFVYWFLGYPVPMVSLAIVQNKSGVQFPPASRLVSGVVQGGAWSPGLEAIVVIPSERVDDFLAQPAFTDLYAQRSTDRDEFVPREVSGADGRTRTIRRYIRVLAGDLNIEAGAVEALVDLGEPDQATVYFRWAHN